MESGSSTIGNVIGVTFAATLVFSVFIFFLIIWFLKRKRGKVLGVDEDGETKELLNLNDGFVRVSGNLKGVIVEENGVDVLYWRNLEEGCGGRRMGFKNQIHRSLKNEDEDEDEEEGVSSRERRSSLQIEEIPLLRPPPPPPPTSETTPLKSMALEKFDKDSVNFNGDIMEALFGYVAATNKKNDRFSDDGKTSPPSQMFILDSHKSQSIAKELRSLGLTRKEIIDALVEGKGLSPDAIEKLAKISPNSEETSQILGFDGDPTKLSDAESFLFHLLKAVPSAFTRFNAMLFTTKTYDSEVSRVRESLKTLESACKELRTRGMFLKLLEAVLKSGIRLNYAATPRGFNLTALKKLSDVKSSDGETTLLQFVVEEVVRAEGRRLLKNRNSGNDNQTERDYIVLGLPIVRSVNAELTNVKKAAALNLNHDVLYKTISTLATQMAELRKTIEGSESEGGFARRMRDFLRTAELEMKVVKEEQARVMEIVKKTTEFYHGTGTNPFQLFALVSEFLVMIDQICGEIETNAETRTHESSLSQGSPRVFKFPKLPKNFISDDSNSGFSEPGNDLTGR